MSFSIRGLDALRAWVAQIRNRLVELEPAFMRAAAVVLTAAQMRIRTKGNGTWAPQAFPNPQGTLLNRTGTLMRSLSVGGMGNILDDIPGGIRVGTGVKTPGGLYSIGYLMQEGVKPIRPVKGKFLVFTVGGQKIFSKGTKGIPARPFLYVSEDDANRVRSVFDAYILRGIA